jgi:hypothetical protein
MADFGTGYSRCFFRFNWSFHHNMYCIPHKTLRTKTQFVVWHDPFTCTEELTIIRHLIHEYDVSVILAYSRAYLPSTQPAV